MDSLRSASFSRRRILLISVLLTATILIGRGARSQESSDSTRVDVEESGGKQRLIPPELIEYVEAEYPQNAFEQNLEAEVLVNIQIDETGAVLAVDVVEPVGHGFDEAAADAIMRFRFRPAMRGDEPIAARLIYRYKFFIKTEPVPDEPSEPPATDPEGSQSGIVLPKDNETLPDVYEVVVRDRRPPREVTRREITIREINKIPGTSGDALRSLHSQPGVARASFFEGQIVIRGSAPTDSVFFFDALNTPLLYHLGSSASIINSDLLERIDLYPSNFSVRYGRATGGVVDATIRAPKTDRLHAYIDADFWDVTAFVESPIGRNWSVAASARRSYIDNIIEAFYSDDESGISVAPRYYDFQIVADYHPDARDNLRMFVFGTDDREVEVENAMKTAFNYDYHSFTYQARLQWEHEFSDNCDNRLNLGVGYSGIREDADSTNEKWDIWPVLIRDELTWRHRDKFVLRVGTDTELRFGKIKMKELEYQGGENEFLDTSSYDLKWIEFEGDRFYAEPSLYTELELTVIPKTRIISGVRADYYNSNKKWGIDPRVAIRFNPHETTTLKAGLGLFHQPPGMTFGDKDQGNPELDLTSAIHYSAGVEQNLFEKVEIGVEGFYKDLRNVITPSNKMIERDGNLVPEWYDTEGIGRVYGMEAQIKHRSNRFFGWIAYTLMKSERRDEAGAHWRPLDYDQTHILTALGSFHVGWGIDVGFKFQLVTGNPMTPVIGFNYDVESEKFRSIQGDYNSGRMPMFHQLDLRVDKKWQWKWLALTFYMDVKNVYNRRNAEEYYYNPGEREKMAIYSLPILPSAGLRLEY